MHSCICTIFTRAYRPPPPFQPPPPSQALPPPANHHRHRRSSYSSSSPRRSPVPSETLQLIISPHRRSPERHHHRRSSLPSTSPPDPVTAEEMCVVKIPKERKKEGDGGADLRLKMSSRSEIRVHHGWISVGKIEAGEPYRYEMSPLIVDVSEDMKNGLRSGGNDGD